MIQISQSYPDFNFLNLKKKNIKNSKCVHVEKSKRDHVEWVSDLKTLEFYQTSFATFDRVAHYFGNIIKIYLNII